MALAAKSEPSLPKPTSTFKIFLQRDYSEGTTVRFQGKYPLELEGKLPRSHFDVTIKKINSILDEAEKGGLATYLQGCFACLTAYLIYVCFDTRYEKCMKKMAHYINEQNESIYVPRGLMIVNPMERGLRVIEISIQA